jgi:hypothetical protein
MDGGGGRPGLGGLCHGGRGDGGLEIAKRSFQHRTQAVQKQHKAAELRSAAVRRMTDLREWLDKNAAR